MKKFLCLMMSLVLLLTAATAFAAVEYTLPEKWQRQVDFGNGVKGTVTVNVSGEAEWAQMLSPLSGVPLQVRAIHQQDGGDFQYRIYAENGEEMVGLTQLYGDDEAIYLKSDLLPDVLLSLTTGGDLLDRLSGGEGKNPALYSAMMNIASIPQTTWEGKWLPALSSYESSLELWLEAFASVPSVKREESGATVLVRYDIPAEAVKSQIKTMWESVLQDETLLPLLQAQLTEEQQAAYLNPDLMYYYAQVIDGVALDGNVVLEREMTAKGEAIRTNVTLPLVMGNWNSLQITQDGTVTVLALQGEEMRVELEMDESVSTPDSTGYRGKLRVIPADSAVQGVAVTFTLVEIRTSSVDDDTRSHEVTTWNLKVQPDEEKTGEGWLAFDPMELYAKVHLHSKSLQVNAVSLEVELAAKWTDAEVSVMVDLITRSPWVMDELPKEGAIDVATLPEGELAQLLADLGLNGLTRLLMMNQENMIPVPEAATQTDLEATTTDMPASPTDAETKPTGVGSAE